MYIYVYINTAPLTPTPPHKREYPRKSFNYMLVVGLGGAVIGTQFSCFTGTGTNVQILTQETQRACRSAACSSLYLLYWYKSTHTDAGDTACVPLRCMFLAGVLGKFMPGKRLS